MLFIDKLILTRFGNNHSSYFFFHSIKLLYIWR